jgi:hypothetical protein
MFSAVPGRTYWSTAGPHWRRSYPNGRDAEFIRILDIEFHSTAAPVTSSAIVSPDPADDDAASTTATSLISKTGWIVGCLSVAGALSVVFRKRHR